MQIIIPKSDTEEFYGKLETEHKELLNTVPIITSELIPAGHYIIEDGNEMKIYYPDGKIVVVPRKPIDLFQMPNVEIKPEKFNFDKTK
jgi:hypothetical protein